jgi:hypothetical protein
LAFTDFYINPNGSDLNAGSTSGSAIYTSTSGNWNGTSVFTPTDGSTPANSVNVGDWCSVYPNSNSVAPYIAKVTAVGSGVNGTITLSTSNYFGTAPASNSGSISIRDGGAWADFGIIGSGAALSTGTVTQSTRINIQAGTYANNTTTLTFALAGAATTPLWWRGYQNTPGDQDGNPTATAGTNIPSITFTTGQMVLSGNHQTFSSMDVSGACTASGGQVKSSGSPILLYRFRSTNTAANTNSVALSGNSTLLTTISCYFKATTTATATATIASGSCRVHGCYFTGGAIGLKIGITTTVTDSVFDTCGGDAIQVGAAAIIANCSIYNPSGNGINATTVPNNGVLIANCYFDSVTSASKYAITNSTGTNTDLIVCLANAYYNCTGTVNGLGDFPLVFDNGSLVASAFVNPGSQNFTINSIGYGLAFPGGFEKLASSVGYLDVGALQHQGGGLGQIMRVAGQHFPVW